MIRSFPQTQESKTGFLKEEEIFQLLNSLPQVTDERLSKALMRVGIECLLMLGLRRSEAASMRMGDLKFEGGQWLILIKGKGGRDRLLPMPPRLINTLSQWFYRITEEESPYQSMQDNPRAWLNFFSRRVDSPILISTRAKTYESPLSDSELARIVRKSGLKAGLIGKISPHMLRATAITYALDQGASHRGVQQMAGWTSPLMISRYDKRRKDPKFSAVHKLKYGFDGKKQKEAKLEESEGIKNTPEKDA